MLSLRNIRSCPTGRQLPIRLTLSTWLLLACASFILAACRLEQYGTQQTFLWPPPSPSSSMVLPHDVLFRQPGTYGDTVLKLEAALTANGYTDRRYFSLPNGGFVILTRLEQTDSTGVPLTKQDRWSTGISYEHTFSPIDIIRRFIMAPPGYYQVLAFVVTEEPFGFRPPVADSAVVNGLFSTNTAIGLPSSVLAHSTSATTRCSVLIYAFSKEPGLDESHPASWLTSGVEVQDRLLKDNLWPTLQKTALEKSHDS